LQGKYRTEPPSYQEVVAPSGLPWQRKGATKRHTYSALTSKSSLPPQNSPLNKSHQALARPSERYARVELNGSGARIAGCRSERAAACAADDGCTGGIEIVKLRMVE